MIGFFNKKIWLMFLLISAVNVNAFKDKVLATINGKPLITQSLLEQEKKRVIEKSSLEGQMQIKRMNGKQFENNLLDGMISREIIRKFILEKGISNSNSYKKDLADIIVQIKDALNTRYFLTALKVTVSDEEVKYFYELNKIAILDILFSNKLINELEKNQSYSFNTLKEKIRALLERDKVMKIFEDEIVRLRAQYCIEMLST